MLSFQDAIVAEVTESDGLCVMAAGLGIYKVIASTMSQTLGKLTLLLNFSERQRKCLHLELQNDSYPFSFMEVTSEFSSSERISLYSSNKILYITSRILIVDMLNHRVPMSEVSGIIINNAHRVNETCTEAFILRLFRSENKSGFIRAFSDRPNSINSGFSKVDRILRFLYVQKLYLWPRFHVAVCDSLDNSAAKVVDLRVEMSFRMAEIQKALVEIMDQCLKDLGKTSHNLVSVEDLNVENGLFRSLEETVRMQMEPVWNNLPRKTKQLVSDVGSLRQLSESLPVLDCVSFLSLLEATRASESKHSFWIFSESSPIIFKMAKERVFRVISANQAANAPPGTPRLAVQPTLEELPKWKLIREVLEEIKAEILSKDESGQGCRPGSVLLVCREQETCSQLKAVLEKGAQTFLLEQLERYLEGRPDLRSLKAAAANQKSAPGAADVALAAEKGKPQTGSENHDLRPEPGKRSKRKTRGRKRAATVPETVTEAAPEPAPDLAADAAPEPAEKGFSEPSAGDSSLPEPAEAGASAGGGLSNPLPPGVVQFHSLEASAAVSVLDAARPSHVVLHDPEAELVRELEVYHAQRAAQDPSFSLRVFSLVYQESTEARKFQASLGREARAFQQLIRQKAAMAVRNDPWEGPAPLFPPPSPGCARPPPTVVVDVREFGSSLPSVLQQAGFLVVPVTLAVADYVLSPLIAVERKSPADLTQSLASGRLYLQAGEICRHYPLPILLLEFRQERRFCLQASGDMGDDINPNNVISKLCLLALHFPRLRIVWSRSLYATAQIFKDLKSNHDQPDAQLAAKVGAPSDGEDERPEAFNSAAIEFLQRLPGVTASNYRGLMDSFDSLAEMATAPLERLASVMGGQRAARTLREFLDAKCPSIS